MREAALHTWKDITPLPRNGTRPLSLPPESSQHHSLVDSLWGILKGASNRVPVFKRTALTIHRVNRRNILNREVHKCVLYTHTHTWLKSEIQTNSVAREGRGSRTYGVRVANEGTGWFRLEGIAVSVPFAPRCSSIPLCFHLSVYNFVYTLLLKFSMIFLHFE